MLDFSARCFLAVVNAGSFTKAGEQLFVSQPAISKQIGKLERELGFPLLERTTRTVRLPSSGKLIYNFLQEYHHTWEWTVGEAQTLYHSDPKLLRIGMLSGWGIQNAPFFYITTFQSAHPDIEVSIHQYDYRELARRLLDDRLDLIWTVPGELKPLSEFGYRTAFTDDLVMYLSSRHPRSKEPLPAEAFCGMKAFIMDQNASLTSVINMGKTFQERGWQLTIVPMPNVDSIFTAVDQCRGCSFTLRASRISNSSNYKVFDYGLRASTVFAWLLGHYTESINLFLNEFSLHFSQQE